MNRLVLEGIKMLPSVEVKFGVPVVGMEHIPGEPVKVMVHQRGISDGDVLYLGG